MNKQVKINSFFEKKKTNLSGKLVMVTSTPFAHLFLPFLIRNKISPIIFFVYE